ncbi:glycosyltransferase family 4 protein [Crocinitomix catalasitica]|nr:glycosyltransferase family 4 protein [Crocinitomix catalasitica]
MRIGIIIGRIGGVDGVALETSKWIDVLERIGHKVFIISGEFENWEMKRPDHFHCPLLSFFSPEVEWEQRKAFFAPDKSPDSLLKHIEKAANLIVTELEKWVLFNQIDCLLSENASALPCHISMGIGIRTLVEKTDIPIVTHDHDFHWERGERYQSVHSEINQLLSLNFPLQVPNVKHAVINTFSQGTLRDKFNIPAVLVPNVMDFETPFGVPTAENELFLRRMGVAKGEIPLLQVTRIVRRKGIETAISLVEKLNDKKIKLLISGNHKDDENNTYYNELVDQIHDFNLMNQVIFAAEKGIKHMELSDFYAHGRACTYFSTYEGFGNTFIESVLAKKPIFVNNYKPVYEEDIACHGFETVLIEDNVLTEKAVSEMAEIIYNPKRAQEIGEHNYELGKKHFSFDILEQKLNKLFS